MLLPQNLNQNHMRVLLLEQMLEGYEIESAHENMKLFPHEYDYSNSLDMSRILNNRL